MSSTALSTLLSDTAALLNDQNYSFTSQPQLLRWVNEARRQCAERTGCVRRLVTGQSGFGVSAQPAGLAPPGTFTLGLSTYFTPGVAQPGMIPDARPFGGSSAGATQGILMTVPGVERYPFEGFFNPVLRSTYGGCDQVIDAVALSVNWGGVSRPTLDWQPWDNFQAYCRAYAVNNMAYPAVWSVYNDGPMGEIWMFPVPSQAGEIELDAICTPQDVYTDSDYEVIPRGFYNALKFLAAELAFMSSQRYAQAAVMEAHFADRLGIARVGVDRGKSPSYYDTRL